MLEYNLTPFNRRVTGVNFEGGYTVTQPTYNDLSGRYEQPYRNGSRTSNGFGTVSMLESAILI